MPSSPTNIGRYQIVNSIGQGGMGTLYLAWDPKLDRQIAIKLLRDDDDELRERFSREARSAARLRHPHIVTIFDVGEHEGQPFIAMEYIHGQTFAAIVKKRVALPTLRTLELIDQLCDGLGFAHKAGIIHRDVKPANVMVDSEGSLKILDFGIARIAEAVGMTQAGMLIGTLNYMSPEQVTGQGVDRRSDIFAVGTVFYEILSFRQAFPGNLLSGILNRILHEPPEPLAQHVRGLDPDVIRIVERAIEKDPRNRYQDLAAMRKDLQTVRSRLETFDQPTQLMEMLGPDPARADARQTPTPSARRGTDREELARRRAAQIEAHLRQADSAFAAGDYDAVITGCEHALLLSADEARALDLLDRARSALEARQADEWLVEAEQGLQRGALTAARDLIDRAAALTPTSARVVDLRRAVEVAVQERERAKERAQAARAAMDRAQASLDKASFEDAVRAADEALVLDGTLAEALALRARAADGLKAQQVEAQNRRAREAVQDAHQRFEAGQHESAVELLDRFEPKHELVTRTLHQLRTKIERITEQRRLEEEQRRHAEEQRRQAEEQRRKEKEEEQRLAEERRRQEKEEEQRLAEERRRKEKEEEQRRHAAEQREEAIRAEAARRAAAEEARARLESAQPTVAFPTAKAPIESRPPASAPSLAEARRKTADVASPEFKVERRPPWLYVGAAAAVLAVGLVAYVVFGPDRGTTSTGQSQASGSPPPVSVPPAASPAVPPPVVTSPPPGTPLGAPGPAPADVTTELAKHLARARTLFGRGEREQAIQAASAAAKLRPEDPELKKLFDDWLRQANAEANRARETATAAGQAATTSASFQEAERAWRTSLAPPVSTPEPKRTIETLRGYWSAASLFTKAVEAASVKPQPAGPARAPVKTKHVDAIYPRDAQEARVAGTVRIEFEIDRDGKVTNPRVVQSIPLLDQAALAAVRQWEYSPALVGGAPVSMVIMADVPFVPEPLPRAGAPPPPVTSTTPPGRSQPPPAPAPADEEAAIRTTLRALTQAYSDLNVDAVARIWPSVNRAGLSKAFAGFDRQLVVIRNEQISVSGATANVACTWQTTVRLKGARSDQTSPPVRTTFRLQKSGDRWIIVERQ